MQTLGVVLAVLEIRWPAFVYRAELAGRGAFDSCAGQKERSPFSASSFKLAWPLSDAVQWKL